MIEIIKSSEFLRGVVEEDYREAARKPYSVRHVFHFVISLFSLRDWVWEEFSCGPSWAYGSSINDFQCELEAQCPEFAIISDLANSAKHFDLRRGRTGSITGARQIWIRRGDDCGFGAVGEGGVCSPSMVEVQHVPRPVVCVGERVLFMWRGLFAANGWIYPGNIQRTRSEILRPRP